MGLAPVELEHIRQFKPIDRLLHWMKERERVRINKDEKRLPAPWTLDPILQNYRFCNVQREDDKVTKWIATNWREPHKDDPDLWFAMVIARLLNLPNSLKELGYPTKWDSKYWKLKLNVLKSRGNVFNAAYIVSTNGVKMDKIEYLADRVLQPLWNDRLSLRPYSIDKDPLSLNEYHRLLMQYDGLGTFIAAQVIADLKYVEPLKSASDWWTFAASGPGSRRGLNRVLGRDVDSRWKESEWLSELTKLHDIVRPKYLKLGISKLCNQSIQNVCCETDKYNRILFGEGTPKQKYNGKGKVTY